MRTATMSRGMRSPKRTPASNPAATISTNPSSAATSTRMPGYFAANRLSTGAMTMGAAARGTFSFSTPVGWSRKELSSSSAISMSASAGRRRARSLCPAAETATLLVVRLRSLTPKRSSSSRMAWLNADGDTPRSRAARRKLPCAATAAKSARSARGARAIGEFYSTPRARSCGLSAGPQPPILPPVQVGSDLLRRSEVMQRRPLGNTGSTVSAIGLGCMGMSEFYGPADDEQSLRALATALDHGIDFLDTADMYGQGHNEQLLGRFLKSRRDGIIVATKFGIVRDGRNYERR